MRPLDLPALTTDPTTAVSDADLLTRFVRHSDDSAFAVLVRRHGPMVLGVCRRLAGADADDAFQATFLVLARRAAAVRRPEGLAAFLHGVARRVALKARARAARPVAVADKPLKPVRKDVLDEITGRELRAALDEELHRLPERYRSALVLCYLEGRTQDEAAHHLGWSPRTLRRRLHAGRALLAGRLERRGLTLAAVLGSGLLAATAVPRALAGQTTTLALRFASDGGLPGAAGTLARAVLDIGAGRRLGVVAALLLGVGLLAIPLVKNSSKEEEAQTAPALSPAPRLDRLGDPLPPGALARMGTNRLRHGGHVQSVAFLPDGTRCVSGGYDGRVNVWDVATGRRLGEMRAGEAIDSIAVSPDGKAVASAGRGPTVRLWDVATGKELLSVPGGGPEGSAVAFAPDGKTLASVSSHKTIHLWDVATGRERRAWQVPAAVARLGYSPDGTRLTSLSYEEGIRIWDAATGKEVLRLTQPDHSLASFAFTPDGRHVVTGSNGVNPLRVWDAATGQHLREFGKTEEATCGLAVAPDGRSVYAAGTNGLCRQWDLATGRERRRFVGATESVSGVALSPDGHTLLGGTYDHNLHLWDTTTGRLRHDLPGHTWHVSALAFTADGTRLFTGGFDRVARAWDAATGRELRSFPVADQRLYSMALALAPDGRHLAVAGHPRHHRVVPPPVTMPILLFDPASGREVGRLSGHDKSVDALAWAPDGRTLASRGGGVLRLWDANARQERATLTVALDLSYSEITFSPDGRLLAAWLAKDRLCLLDATTLRPIRDLPIEKSDREIGNNLHFSSDGKTLVAGAHWQPTRLYEVTTGRERGRLDGLPSYVNAVALAPDGRTVAIGSAPVQLWDLATGRRFATFAGGTSPWGLRFRPDGRRLATGESDGSALIWDVEQVLARRPISREKLDAERLAALWDDLGGDDAAKAYRAVWGLALSPETSVPFLKGKVRPAAASDPKDLASLITGLDADDFATREKATQELRKRGEVAEPALRRALAGTPSAELRRRAQDLLSRLAADMLDAETLRLLRAVEALERAATADARALLEAWGRGGDDARLTRDARSATERLGRRAP